MKLKYYTLSLCSYLLFSCVSNKKYFEAFFVGTEGIQYYIKPLTCLSNEHLVQLDIVLRVKNSFSNKDSATINYTILSKFNNSEINQSILWIQKDTIRLNAVNFMFKEKTKNGFSSRYTSKIANTDLKKCFTENQPIFLKSNSKKLIELKLDRRSKKAVQKINQEIMSL